MTRSGHPRPMPQVPLEWTGRIFKATGKNPPLLAYAHHPLPGDVVSPFNIHLLSTNTRQNVDFARR